MDIWKLVEHDLNLLVVFDTLMQERSLTRAGMKLGRTQSAMSHSLRRLRELLQDPLFARGPDGLLPTARAESLFPGVRALLEQLHGLLQPQHPFDPARDRATVRLVMTDYAQLVLLPGLMARLSREAPGVMLKVLTGSDAIEEQLASGEADLGMGVVILDRPDLYQLKLFDERMVCLVRRGHPVLEEGLTLEAYLRLGHVLVTPRGRPGSFVDSVLESMGLSRQVVMMVPQFMVVPQVIAETDLIVALPEQVARWAAARLPVVLVEPPLTVPGFSTWLVWHQRRQHDPACVWLRDLLREECRETVPER